MDLKTIKKLIEEKSELSQRAFEAYQQLQGQIILLRDMYKAEQVNEAKKTTEANEAKLAEEAKKDNEPKKEEIVEEKK